MTIDEALREAVAEAARGVVTFPADLHGFPGTAHGGAVAAVFHRLALPRPPVALRVELLRGVPTGTALGLRTGSAGTTARLALTQGERPLAEATLHREGLVPPDVAPLRARWEADHDAHEEVPGTATCLACGSANPLGLAVRFRAERALPVDRAHARRRSTGRGTAPTRRWRSSSWTSWAGGSARSPRRSAG